MQRESLREWIRDLFIILLLALVFRAGVAEARTVPTVSMAPTILPGDRLLTDKLFFRFTGIERGDIVVFDPPVPSPEDYVKRVIGLPGEVVAVEGGRVWIDGKPLDEPYIAEPPRYDWGPQQVPAGKLLVLGDNRNHSWDGHAWGFLDIEAVKGRAILRIWPFQRWGTLQ